MALPLFCVCASARPCRMEMQLASAAPVKPLSLRIPITRYAHYDTCICCQLICTDGCSEEGPHGTRRAL